LQTFSSSLSTLFYLEGEESFKIEFIMLYYVYEICFFSKLIFQCLAAAKFVYGFFSLSLLTFLT